MSSIAKAWRKRLAVMLRRFRRIRGYWPDRQVVAAAKHGMVQAVSLGIWPPVEH